MMINSATVGADAYYLLDGSVFSFYAQVDEAIVASEVVKGPNDNGVFWSTKL